MSTEIRIPPASSERQSSPDVHNTMNVSGSAVLLLVFGALCAGALVLSVHAIGKAELAAERSRIAERETRIMQDDLKYIRAYASARGIFIPADHDQAEEYPRSSDHQPQNYHQRPKHTLASTGGPGERRDEQDGVFVRGGPQ